MFKGFLLLILLPGTAILSSSASLAQVPLRGDPPVAGSEAVSPPLTFAEAMDAAVKDQPLIAAKQAAVDVSQAEAVTALQLPDPRLKLGIQSVPVNNFSLTEDSFTQRSVAIEQVVPREEKRRLRSERARIEADMGSIGIEDLRRSVRRDTALAWLGVYGAEQRSELLRESMTLASRQREAFKIAFAAGKTNLSGVKRLDVEVALVEDQVAEARGEATRARAELARWIGFDARRELAQDFPVLPPPKELKYLAKTLNGKPQLRAVLQKITLAENDLAQSRAAKRSDWAIELGYAKRGPAFADFISAQISFDLPLFPANRQDQNVHAKQRLVDQQVQEHADHERMLQTELALAYADWSQFTGRVDIYQRQVLPDAKQRLDATLIDYRTSRGGLDAVLEAQRAEVGARLQWLALRVKAAKARVQLTYFAE